MSLNKVAISFGNWSFIFLLIKHGTLLVHKKILLNKRKKLYCFFLHFLWKYVLKRQKLFMKKYTSLNFFGGFIKVPESASIFSSMTFSIVRSLWKTHYVTATSREIFLTQPISERLKLEIITKLKLVNIHRTQQWCATKNVTKIIPFQSKTVQTKTQNILTLYPH